MGFAASRSRRARSNDEYAALATALRRVLLTFSGGDVPRSKACEAFSQHGYLGVEEQTVAGMAAFIQDGVK